VLCIFSGEGYCQKAGNKILVNTVYERLNQGSQTPSDQRAALRKNILNFEFKINVIEKINKMT